MAVSLVATAPPRTLLHTWATHRSTRPRGPVSTAAVMLPALVLLIVVALLLSCAALLVVAARRWL